LQFAGEGEIDLSALQSLVPKLQDQINVFLTERMEEDKKVQGQLFKGFSRLRGGVDCAQARVGGHFAIRRGRGNC
jgi:hypothetical protein